MSDIIIHSHNTTYIKLEFPNNYGIAKEVADKFSFFAENYQFSPKYKMKVWDGKIRLFDLGRSLLPFGLLSDLVKFAKSKNYSIHIPKELMFSSNVSVDRLEMFSTEILKMPFEMKDYQLEAACESLRTGRKLISSPTGSGKSAILFIICQYLIQVEGFEHLLITVPTTGLVTQIYEDFKDYSQNVNFDPSQYLLIPNKKNIKYDKNASITITTWQSIQKEDEDYFSCFDALLSDEVHTMAASITQQIAKKSHNILVKIGLSGTISNSKSGEMSLVGLYGPIYKTTTTAELIKDGTLSQLSIKAIPLQYGDISDKMKFPEEVKWIQEHQGRNEFITNLTSKLQQNTLVLFSQIEHGQMLFKMIKEANPTKQVFYVAGSVKPEEREAVRKIAETSNDVIIVAGFQVFATGINIKNLHYLILASSSKSLIRILQSIGRILRTHQSKDSAIVFDIFDKIGYSKKDVNYSTRHFAERFKIYSEAKLDVDIREPVVLS